MPPNPLSVALDSLRPVVFDHAAADQLIAALHTLFDEVVAVHRADGEAADVARAEWRGFTRGWFEDRHAGIHRGLRQLGVDVQALAHEVRRAQQAAASMQAEKDDLVRRALAHTAATEESTS